MVQFITKIMIYLYLVYKNFIFLKVINTLKQYTGSKKKKSFQRLQTAENQVYQNEVFYQWECVDSIYYSFVIALFFSYYYVYFWQSIAKLIEMPICCLPSAFLRWKILDSLQLATQGTIDGGCMAIEKGWAINIGGGFHNASSQSGGCLCVYPDISLCIKHLRKFHQDIVQKIMIIDLDAHQGNGYQRDFLNDKDIFIIDFYNHDIYPSDEIAKKAINIDIRVNQSDTDQAYLDKLEQIIPRSISEFQPDFLIYNAGHDILQGDPIGNLNLSVDFLIRRDEYIFQICFDQQIPILMLLGGGYLKDNSLAVASSISNIYLKFALKSKRTLRQEIH